MAAQEDILVTIRFQDSQGLITLNIEYMHQESEDEPLFSYEVRGLLEIFHNNFIELADKKHVSIIIHNTHGRILLSNGHTHAHPDTPNGI